MKKPEEIKKGLECYVDHGECEKHPGCNGCPFKVYTAGDVLKNAPIRDALALIQQLETDNAEKDKRIAELERELAAVRQERNALYVDLANRQDACDVCVHGADYKNDCDALFGQSRCGYEWRGVCPENTEVQIDG